MVNTTFLVHLAKQVRLPEHFITLATTLLVNYTAALLCKSVESVDQNEFIAAVSK